MALQQAFFRQGVDVPADGLRRDIETARKRIDGDIAFVAHHVADAHSPRGAAAGHAAATLVQLL